MGSNALMYLLFSVSYYSITPFINNYLWNQEGYFLWLLHFSIRVFIQLVNAKGMLQWNHLFASLFFIRVLAIQTNLFYY